MFDSLRVLAALLLTVLVQEGEPITDEDPVAGDEIAASWLQHIDECLRDIKSLRADFVQERIHPLGSKTQVMKGTIEARPGGLFRMMYKEPSRLLVSDGKYLWAHNPEDGTVVRSSPGDSALARLVGYFVERGDKSVFRTKYLGGDFLDGIGERAAIEMVPQRRDKYIESIILTVTESCPAVVRALVVENKGPVVRLTLKNVKLNENIGRERFVFVPPRGSRTVQP